MKGKLILSTLLTLGLLVGSASAYAIGKAPNEFTPEIGLAKSELAPDLIDTSYNPFDGFMEKDDNGRIAAVVQAINDTNNATATYQTKLGVVSKGVSYNFEASPAGEYENNTCGSHYTLAVESNGNYFLSAFIRNEDPKLKRYNGKIAYIDLGIMDKQIGYVYKNNGYMYESPLAYLAGKLNNATINQNGNLFYVTFKNQGLSDITITTDGMGIIMYASNVLSFNTKEIGAKLNGLLESIPCYYEIDKYAQVRFSTTEYDEMLYNHLISESDDYITDADLAENKLQSAYFGVINNQFMASIIYENVEFNFDYPDGGLGGGISYRLNKRVEYISKSHQKIYITDTMGMSNIVVEVIDCSRAIIKGTIVGNNYRYDDYMATLEIRLDDELKLENGRLTAPDVINSKVIIKNIYYDEETKLDIKPATAKLSGLELDNILDLSFAEVEYNEAN